MGETLQKFKRDTCYNLFASLCFYDLRYILLNIASLCYYDERDILLSFISLFLQAFS